MSTTSTRSASASDGGWIVSLPFDLLFLANLGWLILLWPGWLPADRTELHLEFWVVYFIIAPHRWITLILVATDPDRREGRNTLFLGIAIFAACLVGGVYSITGSFACLALIDYLWNSWHFASQHQGVLGMYSRKAGYGSVYLERHALRIFIVYVLLRTAGWTTGWLEISAEDRYWLELVDLSLFIIPISLLISNAMISYSANRLGKLVYLSSVMALYSSLLLALRNDWRNLVIALTAASSLFHATEYLAIVTHYAQRRTDLGSAGLFRTMAIRWLGLLFLFIVLLGLIGIGLAHPSWGLPSLWLGANLWAAFLHYAYDGLIWKLRKPATAAALGVAS